MHDSAFDFIIFIVVMGIVVSMGFNLVVPLVKVSSELIYEQNQDKTIQRVQGERVEELVDGHSSIEEIVLQVMGQSYYMPSPRVVEIAGYKIEIEAEQGFSPVAKGVGMRAYRETETWANEFRARGLAALNNRLLNYGLVYVEGAVPRVEDMRFRLHFDYGELESTSDDTYSLHIVLKCRDLGTNTVREYFFKCLPGGHIVIKR